jgi:UPF0271 protein
MNKSIDFNCDLGEYCSPEEEAREKTILRYISSANIACGMHAGNEESIYKTMLHAKSLGVSVGAHPSFPDRQNFGRTEMSLLPDELESVVYEQLRNFLNIASSAGVEVRHVKPHGALYNMAAKSDEISKAICVAIKKTDKDLKFFGLSGSLMLEVAEGVGFETVSEVFADRRYGAGGFLVARSKKNALITEVDEAKSQLRRLITEGKVLLEDRSLWQLSAQTVCIHGDGPKALEFAQGLRGEIDGLGVTVCSP